MCIRDSYNTFYQGVLSYTAGVDQANEGAQQILAGTYTLKALADEEGYETFVVPDDVGGRFSENGWQVF